MKDPAMAKLPVHVIDSLDLSGTPTPGKSDAAGGNNSKTDDDMLPAGDLEQTLRSAISHIHSLKCDLDQVRNMHARLDLDLGAAAVHGSHGSGSTAEHADGSRAVCGLDVGALLHTLRLLHQELAAGHGSIAGLILQVSGAGWLLLYVCLDVLPMLALNQGADCHAALNQH